jgi:hypothetical protein
MRYLLYEIQRAALRQFAQAGWHGQLFHKLADLRQRQRNPTYIDSGRTAKDIERFTNGKARLSASFLDWQATS